VKEVEGAELAFCDRRCRRESFSGLSGNSFGKALPLWSNAIFTTKKKATMRPEIETASIRCGLVICPRLVVGQSSTRLSKVTRLKVDIRVGVGVNLRLLELEKSWSFGVRDTCV
jgi:hypothetical protein